PAPSANPYYAPPPGAPGAAPPANPWGPPPGPAPAAPGAAFSASASADSTGISASTDVPSEETPEDRVRSLQEHNSMYGGTGLLRTMSAGSGAAGTFRVHLLIDWFQTSSFLCFDAAPCTPSAAGQKGSDPDSATHFGANVGLSVTPLPFL